MDRRKFFKILPAVIATPLALKYIPKQVEMSPLLKHLRKHPPKDVEPVFFTQGIKNFIQNDDFYVSTYPISNVSMLQKEQQYLNGHFMQINEERRVMFGRKK